MNSFLNFFAFTYKFISNANAIAVMNDIYDKILSVYKNIQIGNIKTVEDSLKAYIQTKNINSVLNAIVLLQQAFHISEEALKEKQVKEFPLYRKEEYLIKGDDRKEFLHEMVNMGSLIDILIRYANNGDSNEWHKKTVDLYSKFLDEYFELDGHTLYAINVDYVDVSYRDKKEFYPPSHPDDFGNFEIVTETIYAVNKKGKDFIKNEKIRLKTEFSIKLENLKFEPFKS